MLIYCKAKKLMDFAAILFAIRIASYLFVAVTVVSHFHKALIKVELVSWLSLCTYCMATNFVWNVVCDFVHEFWSFHTTCKIILAWCMALNGVLTNDLHFSQCLYVLYPFTPCL